MSSLIVVLAEDPSVLLSVQDKSFKDGIKGCSGKYFTISSRCQFPTCILNDDGC